MSIASGRFVSALVFVVFVPACSILASLDGLSPSTPDASTDAPSGSDARSDAASDGPTADGAPTADGGMFTDDFNRPDGPIIGNGWVQKNADAFALSAGTVLRLVPDTGGFNYEDNVVYRPTSEAASDVEVSIEVTFQSLPATYAQIWARITPDSVVQASNLTGYVFYVNTAWTGTISRNAGSKLTDLVNINFPAALVAGHAYRLRLSVQGASPVHLTGAVDDLADGGVFAQGSYDDTDAMQITTAGTVGFSGSSADTDQNYAFDNFARVGL